MKLVILITAKTDQGMEVAEAWQNAGAPGVTIIRSHGLHTLQERVKSGDVELPRMFFTMSAALSHVLDSAEQTTLIFLSVMSEDMVPKIVVATTGILGDLLTPDTGVVFVLDVEQAIGVRNHGSE